MNLKVRITGPAIYPVFRKRAIYPPFIPFVYPDDPTVSYQQQYNQAY